MDHAYLGGWALGSAMIVAWGLCSRTGWCASTSSSPSRASGSRGSTVAITVVFAIYSGWEGYLPELFAEASILAWLDRRAPGGGFTQAQRDLDDRRRTRSAPRGARRARPPAPGRVAGRRRRRAAAAGARTEVQRSAFATVASTVSPADPLREAGHHPQRRAAARTTSGHRRRRHGHAAATTAAAAATLALLGLVDLERAAVEHRAVHLGNRLLGRVRGCPSSRSRSRATDRSRDRRRRARR